MLVVEGRHGGTRACTRLRSLSPALLRPYAGHAPVAVLRNPDIPVEMAVYTQTAPEIASMSNRIDALAEEERSGIEPPDRYGRHGRVFLALGLVPS